MCFAVDAVPPDPPGGAAHVEGSRIVLTSADGTRFAAFRAEVSDSAPGDTAEAEEGASAGAAAPGRPAGVVILPDVRGLFGFYERLAERFAGVGVDAVAIDYFGRTAGTGHRDADFEFRPHVAQTTPDGVAADIAAAVAHLRERGRVGAIVTVGFCFGGSYSFMEAANTDLAGVVGFYGGMRQRVESGPTPISRAPVGKGSGPGTLRRRRRGHPGQTRSRSSVRGSPSRGSTTRCTPTLAHRTASSTAASTPTHRSARTPGAGSSRSSSSTAPDHARGRPVRWTGGPAPRRTRCQQEPSGLPVYPSNAEATTAIGGLRPWEAPELTGVNRLPGRATLLPYPSAADARAQSNARVLSLDGDWSFRVVDRPEDTPRDFPDPDLDVSAGTRVAVPGNWTMQGHGRPQYTNVQMPFAPNRPPVVPDAQSHRPLPHRLHCWRATGATARGSSSTWAARSRSRRSG